MGLKTKEGMNLVSEEELKMLHDISHFVPVVRNTVSKAWRMLDKLEKMLSQIGNIKEDSNDNRDSSVPKKKHG